MFMTNDGEGYAMKMNYSQILKTTARASFYVASRTIGSTAIGLVANIALLLLLIPEMRSLFQSADSGSAASSISTLLAAWPATLTFIGFGIVFPVAYFILGKRHGMNKAVHYVIHSHREFFDTCLTDKLTEHLKHHSAVHHASKVIPAYLQKMDNMPRLLRGLFRFLIKQADIGKTLSSIADQAEGKEFNEEVLSKTVKKSFDSLIKEKANRPSLAWLWMLLGINILLFVILKAAL
jgi:hypothetical protein